MKIKIKIKINIKMKQSVLASASAWRRHNLLSQIRQCRRRP
ncbi:hypothetical protein [Pseudomonas sp. LF19]|nr:hypothetical protein [Pseudomonas sp. LF19]